jgi:hypothetical protein
MLTNEEIKIIMRSMKKFVRRAQRNMRRIDEARQSCWMCHERPRAFCWCHMENGNCGWHDLCHDCFLKIVDKTCPFCKKKLIHLKGR